MASAYPPQGREPRPPEYPPTQYPPADYPPRTGGPLTEAAPVVRPVAYPTAAERAAHTILRVGFTVLPIIAGLDKFFHYLVNWDQYLSPTYASILGVDPHFIMQGVGIVEIIAGLIVAAAPMIGGIIAMGWLWAIVVNLCLIPGYFDIALRDFGLSLGALALAVLSHDLRVRRYREAPLERYPVDRYPEAPVERY